MPFLLFLLSVATLVAVSSTSRAGTSKPSKTFTLDADMPEALRNQVLAALVSGTDPATLDAFATAIQGQYPLSAGLLHAKATSLRAGIPGSPIVPPALPSMVDPGGPVLDASMPANLVAFVHSELANETDAVKLLALANNLASQYPIASGLLTERAAVLNVQPQAQPITPPAPPPPSPSTPPGPPPPPPPPTPALNMPGMDPGMPPDVAQQVMAALVSENDPSKLQALAQRLQGQYPLATNLLATKANTLLALQQQHPTVPAVPSPGPGVPTGPQVGLDSSMPPETVQLVLNALTGESDPAKLQALADQLATRYPIAAGLLRTRANILLATRPPLEIVPTPTPPMAEAATYTVQQGDYPWKIATHYTGQGGRWPELVAANPKKARAKDGNFASLLPGEKLTIPNAWSKAAPPAFEMTHVPHAPPANDAAHTTAYPPGTLDANIPADVASAVRSALATGTDATKLRGFGNAIAKQGYPIAAGLLQAMANTLGGAAAPLGTYKVKAGDSPAKIAAAFTHDGARWKELVAANPNKKRAQDGNFASLVPGEVLQLPAAWTTAKRAPLPQGGV